MANLGYDGNVTASCQVRDRKASTAWFQDRLGFKLLYDVAEVGWCELATHIKGVNIGLSEVESPKVEGGPTLTWGVKDIAAARAELEGKDVRFDGDTIEFPGMVKLATFYDPDGNHFMLFQSLAQM